MGEITKRAGVIVPASSTAIQFVDDAGDEIRITSDDIRAQFCPKATPQEVLMFMNMCRAQRLNPFNRDAYLVKYKDNPAQMMVAKQVFQRRANSNPNFEGMEHGVVLLNAKGEIEHRQGTACYKSIGEKLLGGWARVHMRGRADTYEEVSLDDYSKGQSTWNQMPGVMIDKVAQATALRSAIPELTNLYSEDEVKNANTSIVATDEAEALPEPESNVRHGGVTEAVKAIAPQPATEAQQQEIMDLVAKLATARKVTNTEVMNALLGSSSLRNAGYRVGEGLTDDQADLAIGQAHAWLEKVEAQEVNPETGEVSGD